MSATNVDYCDVVANAIFVVLRCWDALHVIVCYVCKLCNVCDVCVVYDV